MKVLEVRQLRIGEGMPKIAVPIVGKTYREVVASARRIRSSAADLIEWRADFYVDVCRIKMLQRTLNALRAQAASMPLLFTLRTKAEGGQICCSLQEYTAIGEAVIESGRVDLLDLEYREERNFSLLAEKAKNKGIFVVASRHFFEAMPKEEQLYEYLYAAQASASDIVKLAVLPQSDQDVQRLAQIALNFQQYHPDKPMVIIAMSEIGKVSRICPQRFASVLTFGCLGSASAPGQMEVNDLKKHLFYSQGNPYGIILGRNTKLK